MSWGWQLSCRTTSSSRCFRPSCFCLRSRASSRSANITDDVGSSLGPFVSPQVLSLIQEQMRRLANNENGGLLTFGVAGRCGAVPRRSSRSSGR